MQKHQHTAFYYYYHLLSLHYLNFQITRRFQITRTLSQRSLHSIMTTSPDLWPSHRLRKNSQEQAGETSGWAILYTDRKTDTTTQNIEKHKMVNKSWWRHSRQINNQPTTTGEICCLWKNTKAMPRCQVCLRHFCYSSSYCLFVSSFFVDTAMSIALFKIISAHF